jgi:hypothetical protein
LINFSKFWNSTKIILKKNKNLNNNIFKIIFKLA